MTIDRYVSSAMRELWSEKSFIDHMLLIEVFATEAMVKLGVADDECLEAIKGFTPDITRVKEIEAECKHDVVALLISIEEKLGAKARFIHRGMTSSDVKDTALAMSLKASCDLIDNQLRILQQAIESRISPRGFGPLMIGRTHGMHAEPVSFDVKLCVWLDEVKRNIERLASARTAIAVGKIAGPVGMYADIDPYVEQHVCSRLGLKPAMAATQVIQRDRHAQYVTTLAIIMGTLEKIATEIRNLQRTEIGEFEEPFDDDSQVGSSAMPHKRNPIVCERVSGLARVVRGHALAALENIALWGERDLTHSSVERIILPESSALVEYCIEQMARVISGMHVSATAMRRNLCLSMDKMFSHRVMLALIDKGMERNVAHELVRRIAFTCSTSLIECVRSSVPIKSLLTRKEIDECFDEQHYVRNVELIIKRLGIEESEQ